MYPEKVTAARLRGMACRMAKGFAGSASLREAVSHTRSTRELLDVLDRFEVLWAASTRGDLPGEARSAA